MKKILLLLVALNTVFFISCSDNTVENLLNNELNQKTDPGNNGTIKDTDPNDDGEGRAKKNIKFMVK